MSDLWPDEPDEPDPESRWGDPEHDLVKIPEVSIPDASSAEISSDVARYFWASVLLANVGIFALCLGPMLIYFRGQWTLGGGLMAGGTLALARTYYYYRQFNARERDESDGEVDADGTVATVDAVDAVDAVDEDDDSESIGDDERE